MNFKCRSSYHLHLILPASFYLCIFITILSNVYCLNGFKLPSYAYIITFIWETCFEAKGSRIELSELLRAEMDTLVHNLSNFHIKVDSLNGWEVEWRRTLLMMFYPQKMSCPFCAGSKGWMSYLRDESYALGDIDNI